MIVARLLLCAEELGVGELSCGDAWLTGEGDCEVCWNTFVCRVCAGETQEEHLSEVVHDIHEFGSLTILE